MKKTAIKKCSTWNKEEEMRIKNLVKMINKKNNKVVGKKMNTWERTKVWLALSMASAILSRIKRENTTLTNRWAATVAFALEFQRNDYATTHLLDQKDREMAMEYQRITKISKL